VTDRRDLTPAEFRAAVRTRGMTMEAFARDYGKHPVSVYRWGKRTNGKGVLPFPVWVVRLVESWQEPADTLPPPPDVERVQPRQRSVRWRNIRWKTL
jgi:hypothetical protein